MKPRINNLVFRKTRFFQGPFRTDGAIPENSRVSHSGFTMIEIMVVVAIIGVLASLAATQFSTLMSRTRTKSAARDIRGALQQAKLEAIRQNTDCLVVFTAAAGTSKGTFTACISTDTDCVDADDTVVRQINLSDYKNVALDTAQFTAPSTSLFFFNSRGAPRTAINSNTVSSGSVTLTNENESDYSITVQLLPSGGVIIQ